jgi:hypothetical protein
MGMGGEKRMKKIAIVLVSVLALSMAFMVVAPVFAKPYEFVVIAKYENGDPVNGAYVQLDQRNPSIIHQTGILVTGPDGKVTFTLDSSWSKTVTVNVWVNGYLSGSQLKGQWSGREIVKLPNPTP